MKNLFIALACFCFAGLVMAKQEQLVPLEVFAKHSQFKDVEISPTGEFLAFTYEEGTEVKLAVMERKTKKVISHFGFGDNRHVVQFAWLNNDRLFLQVQTVIGWLDGANANTKWYATNVDGSQKRILWEFIESGMRLVSILEKDPKHILVMKYHWADEGKGKLHTLNVYNSKIDYLAGAPMAARHTEPGIIDMGVDINEDVRFAFEFDQGEDVVDDMDNKFYVHYKEDKNSEWQRLIVPAVRDLPEVSIIGMSADNNRAYFLSNFDQKESDTLGLFEFNVKTKEITFLYRHPDVDILGPIMGSKKQVIGVYLEPGYPEVFYIENKVNKKDIEIAKTFDASFPGQSVYINSRTKNNELSTVWVYSDRNPGEFYIYDEAKNKLKYLASNKPEVKPSQMARVEPFTMKARDGLKMYGQLTIPNNVEEKNLPLVIYPHGGPYQAYDNWGWDRRAQMLASRGYLVLQLNYRGSGRYGEDFHREGFQEWGAKMQDDLTDATWWAIKTGIADKNRICIHGVSYGGYASLQAVVKEPDLYKCAIPDAGVYEMAVQWDKADSFRGSHASEAKEWYMNRAIGGYDFVKERSPVYHLDKLKAALFLVHGESDVRVPIINAELVEEELKRLGKPYLKMYKEEEGHGFTQEPNRIELYQAILSFLEKHIGPGAK